MKSLLKQQKRSAAYAWLRTAGCAALLFLGGLMVPAQEPPPGPGPDQPPPEQEVPADTDTNRQQATAAKPAATVETTPAPAPAQNPVMVATTNPPADFTREVSTPAGTNQTAGPSQEVIAAAETNQSAAPTERSSNRSRNNRPRNNRATVQEQEPATGVGTNELAFKIIYERNIFNPNRGPRNTRRSEEDAPKPVKIEGFSLVGTLMSEKGDYAFFDGTEARYRAALKTSNTIAGFTLAAITPNSVTLQSPSNAFDLSMNMQMKKQDEGEWELMEAKGSWNSTNAVSSTNATAAASDEDGASDPAADEVMKRLIKKREEESKK